MVALLRLVRAEFKLFAREPIGLFFSLAFPVLLLLLFGSIYGNEPADIFGGLGTIDVSVPAYTAMIIGTTGLMSLPITVAGYREKGVLRRYRVTPVAPVTILVAQGAVMLAMTILGMALLILVGVVLYGLTFHGRAGGFALGFLLSCLGFYALGFLLGALLPTARSTQIVAMAIFYPMLFLSGAGMPRELLPPGIRRLSEVLPLTHVVTLLRGLWVGDPWGSHLKEVAVLGALVVVGTLLAARLFRWE
jgi:ABC-2 type transport system permease protein